MRSAKILPNSRRWIQWHSLDNALAALEYKDADYSRVDAAIAKVNSLDRNDYKDFTAVDAAVATVVRDKNITEQSEVDAMATAIFNAVSDLEYKDTNNNTENKDNDNKKSAPAPSTDYKRVPKPAPLIQCFGQPSFS